MVKLAYLGAVLVSAATILAPAPTAHAGPLDIDPHDPDLTRNHCPGGQWGFGRLRVCDGEKYPDGSYWHQWRGGNGWVGPTWNYDCVGDSGNNIFPGPPTPDGCDGAIPPDPPPSAPPPPGDPAPPAVPGPTG